MRLKFHYYKKAFVVIYAGVIICLGHSTVWGNTPEWYRAQNIPAKTHEIIGYGQGSSFHEARVNAQQDIAGQISTDVRSEYISEEIVTGTDAYRANRRASLSAVSQAVLTDLETVKTTETAGRFFVALRYNILPLENRAVAVLGQHLCKSKPLPRILQSNDFTKRLSEALACPVYFEIKKTGNVLRLYAGGQAITLRPGEFQKFLGDISSEGVRISTPNRVLREQDTYFLTITASKDGFLSLFAVDEQGQVFRLMENKSVMAGEKVTFPDPEIYAGLEALITEGYREGRDLYVSVMGQRALKIGHYMEISENIGQSGYEFDRFVNQVDDYEFATIAIRVVRSGG